jgi:phosphatidylserine decarboxylase
MTEPGAVHSTPPTTKASDPEPPALRGLGRALWLLLALLPKNAMSRWMGWLASRSLPGPVQRLEIRLFARLAGVDLGEARDDVSDFASLQEFFTRALVPGARPIQGDERVLVSPCDGAWGEAGRIEAGTLLQVKGRRYRVAELLGDARLAEAYDGGCYATFYLSPRDYHRFHTPASGRITRIDYLPGALWPVNTVGLHGVDRLFARNERICALLEPDALPEDARAPGIALVAVGATMVGSVRLCFAELRTNVPGRPAERREFGQRAPHFARGQEWGHFEFGSTIVMLTPPGGSTIRPRPAGTALRLGEAIGRVVGEAEEA